MGKNKLYKTAKVRALQRCMIENFYEFNIHTSCIYFSQLKPQREKDVIDAVIPSCCVGLHTWESFASRKDRKKIKSRCIHINIAERVFRLHDAIRYAGIASFSESKSN